MHCLCSSATQQEEGQRDSTRESMRSKEGPLRGVESAQDENQSRGEATVKNKCNL